MVPFPDFTDSWKATPRLTLNYGLRWEPFNPLHLKFGAIYGFSLIVSRRVSGARYSRQDRQGLYYPGDPGFRNLPEQPSTTTGGISRHASDLPGI